MNPCVIIFNKQHNRLEAFNEDGRCFGVAGNNHSMFEQLLQDTGYYFVPLNSRLGRTIIDKVEGHRV